MRHPGWRGRPGHGEGEGPLRHAGGAHVAAQLHVFGVPEGEEEEARGERVGGDTINRLRYFGINSYIVHR